ncbi:MAG: VTT domain-containing protein [Verrucomicrobiota bacterium]
MNDQDQGGEARRRVVIPVKPLIVLAVLALGILVVYFSPLRGYLHEVKQIKARLAALGVLGPVVYMAVVFVLISMGFPRLLFCPIGGMAFGFVRGLLWTFFPTLLGYYVIFLFVRWGGRDFVLRHWPRLARPHRVFETHAVPAIVLIRQLPISGLLINLALGVSPVGHVQFLVGTAIGLIPEAIPFTLVASGAVKMGGGESAAYVLGAIVILVLLWGGMWVLARRSRLFAEVREEAQEDGLEQDGK